METPLTQPTSNIRPVGKVRSLAFVYVVSLVTLSIYAIYWWYKINDEVGKHIPEIKVKPWISALAFSIFGVALLFIPAIVTVYNTARRIKAMETKCRVKKVIDPDRALWLYIGSLLPIPFIFPLNFFILGYFFVAEIQDNLNGHWKWHMRQERAKKERRGEQKAA